MSLFKYLLSVTTLSAIIMSPLACKANDFCRPGSSCDLRKQESQGIDTGVKKFYEGPSMKPCKPPSKPWWKEDAIWFKGQKLFDPKCPNKCAPLNYEQINMPSSTRGMGAEIYKMNRNFAELEARLSKLEGRNYLYPTPHDADLGNRPHCRTH